MSNPTAQSTHSDDDAQSDPAPLIAVLIPARDEAENLPGLLVEIDAALSSKWPFEVIIIDDGSTDHTGEILIREMERWPWLRAFRQVPSAGKSTAVRTAALATDAPIIVSMDGDGQNNPADIPEMINLLRDKDNPVALVCAERLERTDPDMKKIASRIANAIRSRLLHDQTRDTGNGLKAMWRDAFLALPFFNTMHRFVPALVVRDGLGVGHIDVVDRERRHGESKYGILDRAIVGLPDLLGALWLRRRRGVIPKVTEIQKPSKDLKDSA